MTDKLNLTDAEWREQLTPEQYRILREHGTERAFTGKFWDHHEHGIYHCVCCDTPLFESDAKFESGCGWRTTARMPVMSGWAGRAPVQLTLYSPPCPIPPPPVVK